MEHGPLPFSFLALPPEVQDVVVRHMSSTGLLRFQRTSRQCHQIASRRAWKHLSFHLEDTPNDSGAGRFTQVLQTLICSKHDYAQYIRSFALVGNPSDIHSLNAALMFQLHYSVGGAAQQAISVNMLGLLHRASNLERFACSVPLALNEAVWQQLAALKSLSSLKVSMRGYRKPTYDPRYGYLMPTQPVSSADADAKLLYYDIANFSRLRSLTLTHINEPNHVDRIAACIQRCSSKLLELHLSISEEWYDRARMPSSQVLAQVFAPTDPLPLDDPDDLSILSDEDAQPAVEHGPTPAEKDLIHTNRAAQESLLAKLFTLEPGNKFERMLGKVLKPNDDARSKTSETLEDLLASCTPEIIGLFLKGAKMDRTDTEMIDKLRSRLKQASKSRKKAKTQQPVDISEANLKAAHQQVFMPAPAHSAPPPLTGWPAKQTASPAYTPSYWYPQHPGSQHQLQHLHQHYTPSHHPAGPKYYAVPPNIVPSNAPPNFVPSNVLAAASSASAPPFGTALPSPGNPFSAAITSKTYPSKPYTGHHSPGSKKLPDVPKHILKTHSGLDVATYGTNDAYNPSAVVYSKPKDPISTTHEAYEDMNIDIEHPDEISGESGEDQESDDELDAPVRATDEEDEAKGKGKGKGKDREDAGLPKRALPVEEESQSHEDILKRWVTESHGLALRRFSLYMIPLKASVVARAVQVHSLREVTLLGVGGQAPFWQMMLHASKEGPLQLASIQTDDVSKAFTTCLSHLTSVEVLILRKRNKKDKFNTTTKEAASLNEIRKGLQPHVPNLRVLVIQNDESGAWHLTAEVITLLLTRARNLEEFAFKLPFPKLGEFFLPLLLGKMPKLRAMHLLNPRPETPSAMPGGPYGTTEHALASPPALPHTLAIGSSLSSIIVGVVKDCIRMRKASGHLSLRHIGVHDQFLSVTELNAPKAYPDWLIEEFEKQPPTEATIDDWARQNGVRLRSTVAFKNVTLSSLEKMYKIFTPQVVHARTE